MNGKGWGKHFKLLIQIMIGIFGGLFFSSVCVHAMEAQVIDSMTYDGSIYIYVRGITQLQEGSSVQIGNVVCSADQILVTSFHDMELSVRTLVLIDNSKSISEQGQRDIREILEGLISVSMDNEQMKIGTFSDKAAYLCDYTGDKDILNNVLNSILYYDQESYLSDVLYDEITALEENTNSYCTRLLVLSDGADDNSIGYTNEEVRSYIGENACQVYTVGIPGKNNSQELETMFSFSRAAKSDYFLMDGSIAGEDVVNTIRQDQEGICLKITPDESQKDGSAKNVLLQLDTPEGNVALTVSVNMPFGTGIPSDSPQTEESEAVSIVPEESAETIEEADTKDNIGTAISEIKFADTDARTLIGKIIGILLIILLVTVGILFVIFKIKKNDKQTGELQNDPNLDSPKEEKSDPDITKASPTEDTDENEEESDRTLGIFSKKYLVLKCIDMPNIMYKIPIEKRIIIGRSKDSANIVLDDQEVSRSHCEILLYAEQLYIKDCKSKNHTFYEGAIVPSDEGGKVPITNRGKLKIGTHVYTAELVKDDGSAFF